MACRCAGSIGASSPIYSTGWRFPSPPCAAHDQPVKFEDYVKDSRYVLRAELPGDRTRRRMSRSPRLQRRSDQSAPNGMTSTGSAPNGVRLGSFARSVTLPASVDDNDVEAFYDKGVLEVSVKLTEIRTGGKRIQVESKPQAET